MPAFGNSAYPLFYSVPTDCRSIHIGLSVPSYPHRKRDQKGHLPGQQKVRWGLRPDKPQQGLASAGSSMDHVSKTREFWGTFWGPSAGGVQTGQGRGGGLSGECEECPTWLRPQAALSAPTADQPLLREPLQSG